VRDVVLRRVRRHGRPADDAGLTLVELLVTMMVFSVAVSLVYSAVILVQRRTSDAAHSAAAVGELRQALAQIDRQVRSGNVLYSPAGEPEHLASCAGDSTAAAGTCMRIYTQTDVGPRCIQWQVVADATRPGRSLLRSRSWAPDWTTTGSVSGWETVARGLAVPAGTYPFALAGSGTAYGARLLSVRLEAVDDRRGANVTITSSLSGRNTNYGYDGGQCLPVPAG
jgi:prepilin-type N-terminal cleavage/methylation domain-containing protein